MISKQEVLKELGLNNKEVSVYVSLLMLGQSPVNIIAKKSKLNRVTTYDILKSLLDKGYVSYVIKSGVKYFEATNPSIFMHNLKEKQSKLRKVLPELKAIKRSIRRKPSIEMYEEIKGLKSIFNDILKENKETWFIGAPKMIGKLKFYFPHFIKQKRKQNMFSRVITTDCRSMRKYKRKAPKKYIGMRFINDKINTTKIIYENKIAYLTFKDKNSIGIIIDNKEIAKQEKALFNILWKNSKK